MMWTLTQRQDGAPVWRGFDSIYDVWIEQRMWRWIGGLAAFAIGLPVSLIGATLLPWAAGASASGAINEPAAAPFVYGFLSFLCFGMALAMMSAAKETFARPRKFIDREWTLSAARDQLFYRAGEFDAPLSANEVSRDGNDWSVELDDIARVESGPTTQWQAVRHYEGAPFNQGLSAIPRMESQTFLFLTDGSRRVILTVNGDPESAATLAHSIRSWIESHRNESKVKTASPAALITAGEEGFDL